MDDSKPSNHIVFLDKNHPEDVLMKITNEILTNCPTSADLSVKFVYLVPEIDPKTYIFDTPFSSAFLA